MEKLIEILNKYQEEKGSEIRFKRIDNSDFFVCGDDVGLGYETILSKKFGFIKWLVDNDKIDTVLFANELNKVVYLADFNFRNDEGFYKTIYKQLLMLLSIQDNPIEFLISILKIS